MIEFFIRLFIGKTEDPTAPAVRGKYASLAGFTGITLNLLLFIGKLVLGLVAASVAMIADAFNNISDAGSAIVTLIGFRLASKHVDKEHPLGHGRLEYVSAFIVDMIIILVGFELFKGSVDKILNPVIPDIGNITLIVLGIAILVKVWLFFFYRKVGDKIHSSAIKAASFDSLADCFATGLVLISAVIARLWNIAVDGWAGVLVAGFIFYTGIKAAKETIDLLLGSPPEKEFIDGIYEFVKAYPSIVGIHDVMVHDYGPGRQIVSFHAEVPSDFDINIAHEEVDKLERDMHEKFGCIVTVHLDPIVVGDEMVNELRSLAQNCAREVNESFTIHDFRMTKGEKNINLIFDLVLPVDCEICESEAEKSVAKAIRDKNPACNCVIKAEHPFV